MKLIELFFIGKTCGICGNFNDNQDDDFTTPELDVVVSPETFGDSWKVTPTCLDTLPPTHPCSIRKEREQWSYKQCNIINRDVFQPCHSAVDPGPYFDACYFDTCGCDIVGDCHCLCTAVAAYAQVCTAHGVHIKWRSQEFCRKSFWDFLFCFIHHSFSYKFKEYFQNFTSSHRRCSLRKGAFKNFAKVTGKHLRQSLFFNKVFIKKETPAQVFSCEYCEIFKNTFFIEHLWTTAYKI